MINTKNWAIMFKNTETDSKKQEVINILLQKNNLIFDNFCLAIE
jgi:hypothetical protein